jgi:hypothetical protein
MDRYVCQQCLFTAVSVDRTDSADGMINRLSRRYEPLAQLMVRPIDSADGMTNRLADDTIHLLGRCSDLWT